MTTAVKTPNTIHGPLSDVQLAPIYSQHFLSFQIETPSKVYFDYSLKSPQDLPFYRKDWFVVSLAAASIVIIIIIVAILCVVSKTHKYKGKKTV